MTIEEFVRARIADVESRADADTEVLKLCEALKLMLDWHEQMTVLMRSQPKLDFDIDRDANTYVVRMTQQIEWATIQSYRDKFGGHPTSLLLFNIASLWKRHRDFNPEWING